MLHLLLGPSGSGKSRRVLAALKARAEAGQRSVLLVPEQFTSSTEGILYEALGDRLSGFVDSYSFTSLAETLLRRYGGAAVPTLSEAGRAVLVRRALDAVPDKIVYYSRQRQSAAFCEKAAQTIDELKSAGIRPEQLAAYALAPGADHDKLSELALIYGTYEALLAQTAMDPGDRVELAARRLQADFFAGQAVFLDEFDTFNASKRAMLAAMLPAADVTAALCCGGLDDADDGFGVFSGVRQVALMLRRMAAGLNVESRVTVLREDLRHAETPALAELALLLEDPDYTPQCTAPAEPEAPLVQYIADTRQAEAKAAAAAIRAKARADVPYGRMAVICRDAALYLPAVRYEFRLQNIPLFCDEPTTPEHTAPARAVLAALELLRGGIGSRTVLALVKTGLVDLPEETQCALENYAYTWNLHAEDWRQPFTRSPAGYDGGEMSDEDQATLARAEEARAFLAGQAQRFLGRARGAAVPELTRSLYLFLQAVGAEKSLTALAESLRAAGRHPEADEAVREWNTVTGLLNELVQLLPADAVLSAADYADLFTLLLRTTDMGHIPQSLDSVIFTTAGRMRLPEVDACFVLGLAEGEFPQLPGDTGLLTHADRDAMMAQGAELPDCFENRVIREKVCFYKALTAPRQFLWLSWPGGAGSAGGLGLPVSAALAPVLERLAPPDAAPAVQELAAAPAAALDLLGSVWQSDTPQRAAVEAALQTLEGTTAAVPGFAAVARTAAEAPAQVGDTAALEALLGRSLRISPTRFERYAACPFGYFMQYVLDVRPRKKAELAPNISGTLTHWVLEQALARQGDAFKDLSEEQIGQLVDALIEEYVTANLPGAGTRMRYLLARIRRNLVGLLGFIQRDIRQSGFRPAAFELRIDDRPGADPAAPRVAPVELDDGAGHTVRVVGTVDRVDTMHDGETTWLRVVDYKTGTKKFDLKEVYYGLDCQMLLYLFTLERNGQALFPGAKAAGVEYLLADPSPKTGDRPDGTEPAPPPVYPLDGLLLDEEAVWRAMDPQASGEFVPLAFSERTGRPTAAARRRLAGPEKLDRIRRHLDGLLLEMAKNLYSGKIDAAPFCPNGSGGVGSPCTWCDFRPACRRRDGEDERLPTVTEDPFEVPTDENVPF